MKRKTVKDLDALLGPRRVTAAKAAARRMMESMLVAEVRKQLGFKQVDVARAMGVSQSALSHPESRTATTYVGSQSDSITYPIALMTSRNKVSSKIPRGPVVRSICESSIDRMFSHCATQSAVNPNCPARNGTQLGSVLRTANRADVQTTATAYRPRFRLSLETTMIG